MRGVSRLACAAGMMAAVATGAAAQTTGDWVLARYKGGAYWYPGIIQGLSGDRVTVAYDDGDRETLSLAALRPYDWAIGRKVECNFKGAGRWYPGTIASLAGGSIGIDYDDGDKERTNTGRCRSR
ncbi:tudor domain-containing protein [Methylobacterium trifolii]|uniref:Tudor domain-containing protein n=1 Tax=Methylobacterium trifolii TaxID=1003092 RepID=A0ABQ4U449_9HYPH|nr:tudor domain-containing protein [Methylobacterium trifolii]GJE60605.1 hypothetical protein MPOCJGCO_2719 [Methylobacterium trifolii]